MSNNSNHSNRTGLGQVMLATVLIVVGLLFLGRNFSLITPRLFHILMSWPMLFIIIGLVTLAKRNISSGIALIAVGGYFLVPRITGVGMEWYKQYWPVFLILGGFGMLLELNKQDKKWLHNGQKPDGTGSVRMENGYVTVSTSFKSVKYCVRESVFQGACLDASFGSIALDLRMTELQSLVTYIDIANSFGGIELYLPSSWKVIIEANTSFGGIEDKRFMPYEIDYEHKLIIRGNISFGGIEIKS